MRTFLTAKAKKVEKRCLAIAEVLFFRLVILSRTLKRSLSRSVTMAAICFGSNQNAEESEDTIGCTEKEIELDVPGKNIWLAWCISTK